GSTSMQSVASQTETPKRYRYTGKERDSENDLSYHGARYYAPWLGRWTACDPVAENHPYAYAHCRPTTLVDPRGTQPTDPYRGSYRPVGGDHVHQVAS